MSNFSAKAIHPITGVIEDALFIDNHFGQRKYGVMFSDKKIFRIEDVREPPKESNEPR